MVWAPGWCGGGDPPATGGLLSFGMLLKGLSLKTPSPGEVNLLQTYSPCHPKSYEKFRVFKRFFKVPMPQNKRGTTTQRRAEEASDDFRSPSWDGRNAANDLDVGNHCVVVQSELGPL